MAHSEFTPNGRLVADAIVNILHANGIEAEIKKVYFDYGQDWTWDTIIVDSNNGGYQALNPAQHKQMDNGTFDYAQVNEILEFARSVQ